MRADRVRLGGQIEDVALYVSAHLKHPSVAAVSCPECKADKGKPCLGGSGKPCKPHMKRVVRHQPWLSRDVQREPCLRVACPTCHSPAWVRCQTAARKFTKAHAERVQRNADEPWVEPTAFIEDEPARRPAARRAAR